MSGEHLKVSHEERKFSHESYFTNHEYKKFCRMTATPTANEQKKMDYSDTSDRFVGFLVPGYNICFVVACEASTLSLLLPISQEHEEQGRDDIVQSTYRNDTIRYVKLLAGCRALVHPIPRCPWHHSKTIVLFMVHPYGSRNIAGLLLSQMGRPFSTYDIRRLDNRSKRLDCI